METPAEDHTSAPSQRPAYKGPRWARWALAATIVVVALAAARLSPHSLEGMRDVIRAMGFWAPLVYVLLHSTRAVTWLPGSILSPLGGLLFGFWQGLLLTWLGLVGTCALAFAIARWMRPPDRSGPVARRFDRLIARFDGRIAPAVLVSRLIFGIPFNVSSYLAGATPISWSAYLVATGVGVVPRMGLQVALGAWVYAVGAS